MFSATIHLLCGILAIENIFAEPITLQENNSVQCLHFDIASAIFVSPPVLQSNKQSLLSIRYENDGWEEEEANTSVQAPVIDKRWEDFEVTKTYEKPFKKSISFSVYSEKAVNFDIHITQNDKPARCNFTIQWIHKWIHHTIVAIDNTVLCIQNNHIIKTIKDIKPNRIYIKNKQDFYLKIHEYSFKTTKTANDQGLKVRIPPGLGFYFLYSSLCEKCLLEVIIDAGGNTRNQTISSVNNSSSSLLKPWVQHTIEVDPAKGANILIFSKTTDNSKDGYWAFDMKPCPAIVDNMSLYKINASEEVPIERTCHVLNAENKEETDNNTFCNEVGKLGKNCNITCESILGPKFKHCEKHKICYSSDCRCAWGYHGLMCQQNTNKNYAKSETSNWLIVVSVIATALVILIIYIIWKRKQRTEQLEIKFTAERKTPKETETLLTECSQLPNVNC